jgi:hypothetical protein
MPPQNPQTNEALQSVWRRRWRRVLALAIVSYLAAAALAGAAGAQGGEAPGLLGFGALVLAWALAFRAGGASKREAWPLFLASLAIASTVAGASAPLYVRLLGDAAAIAGFGVTTLALARLSAASSLASLLSPKRSLLALAPVAIGFAGAGLALAPPRSSLALAAALLASAASVVAVALAELVRRRFELGVRARTLIVASAFAVGLVVAIAMSRLARSGLSDVVLSGALAPASVVATFVALRADELAVARASRLLAVLAVLGGGLVLLGMDFAFRQPLDAPSWMAVFGVLTLGAGAAAHRLGEGLRPERGAWLDAIARAEDALLRDGTEDAVREALVRLRAPAGPHASSPELWSFDPVRVLSVDAAGYARESDATFPDDVVRLASEEPEATLRTEVLRELEVRRPDVRPALRWLADRTAMAAVVVTEGGEARGLLVVPAGARSDAMTLEEVTALKRLADRFAGVVGYRAAIARGLERERDLKARIERLDDRVARLEHGAAREAARHERATLRHARPATVGLYAASSRLAYEALEARTRLAAPFVIVHPSGVDPVPYVARAHLAGARARGALVLVDGTASREHEESRWTDPIASPLAHADGGLLLLVDGAVLPMGVQRLVAHALAAKRAPWERAEPLDVVLALTTVTSPATLVESGRLDPALAARLGDAVEAPIGLPGLADRAEDLRALLTDRLAREGLRVRGEPVALGDGALARLIEHAFPGDETELASIVQRLVAGARGSLLEAQDVDALGLPEDPTAGSLDPSHRPRIRLV